MPYRCWQSFAGSRGDLKHDASVFGQDDVLSHNDECIIHVHIISYGPIWPELCGEGFDMGRPALESYLFQQIHLLQWRFSVPSYIDDPQLLSL